MVELLLDPPFWAWLALAGLLLIIEINLGTFDLLWPAAGAGLTGLATMAPFSPSGPGEWLLFALLTFLLAIAARALGFRKNLEPVDKRPLNSAETRIGRSAVALTAFSGGRGRVRVGDTDWTARAADGASVQEGQALTVTGTDGTELLVTAAN
ncbi:NfeD family protein [Parvularcula sp. ZS-1/3]|uniref:NfeD family protein n=1 Tax=Parvularcula mediterranea TaxID=2732508 RepID=A0A7Y3RJU0_9PROT|nr:NfeD family protein [Parvularcula mediterranea]NNU15394.1 NfeD family protein [Parvularcula mediterranea]